MGHPIIGGGGEIFDPTRPSPITDLTTERILSGRSLTAGRAAVFGAHNLPGENAGYFDGNVEVTGTISAAVNILLKNADGAEDFDVADGPVPGPGTVMVLDRDGSVRASDGPYDPRVAGVVSGAGTYRPAMRLDHRESERNRVPIALFGKVWCLADARSAPITLGDLLTTGERPGHAMRATDRQRSFGAVLGKALAGLPAGTGLVPILVALQ
ncbi:MAG TPA: hypothetical protein VMU51_25940 [Mycobacteriales bacterium]|nr:hypothetical protein [Mycobacteriales bacterium]